MPLSISLDGNLTHLNPVGNEGFAGFGFQQTRVDDKEIAPVGDAADQNQICAGQFADLLHSLRVNCAARLDFHFYYLVQLTALHQLEAFVNHRYGSDMLLG